MQSPTRNPGTGAAAAHRPELYGELRKRNERRVRVARLADAQRDLQLRAERVMRAQRASLQGA